jgi:hypothetical protein
MRVLVFSRARTPGANVRLLGSVGTGLVDRGASVAYATCGVPAVTAQLIADNAAASVFPITANNWFTTWLAMRTVMKTFAPDAVIVESESDTLLAAVAARRGTGIVRRLRPQEDALYRWKSRIAARFNRTALLVPSTGDEMALPRNVLTVRAPVSLPMRSMQAIQLSNDGNEAPPVIACVPDRSGAAAALCLRAFARLRQRRPELSLLLLGDPGRLQSVRIHAAALGLTEFIRTLPESALFDRQRLDLAMVWVAARGDRGALSAVAAMSRGLPVIVERSSDVSAFVAHRITGLHVEDGDLSATIASMAQLLADPDAFRSTCEAAIARSHRLHSWTGFLDRVVEAIELTRSVPRSRSTRSVVPA